MSGDSYFLPILSLLVFFIKYNHIIIFYKDKWCFDESLSVTFCKKSTEKKILLFPLLINPSLNQTWKFGYAIEEPAHGGLIKWKVLFKTKLYQEEPDRKTRNSPSICQRNLTDLSKQSTMWRVRSRSHQVATHLKIVCAVSSVCFQAVV